MSDMKKTVFKGTINGQEFDNVQDYNTRMTELVGAGADINATSSTQIVDVEEKCECKNESQAENNNEVDSNGCEVVNMLPGFNPPSTQGTLLNELLTGNEKADSMRFEIIKSCHKALYPKIADKIKNMDRAALSTYLNELNTVINEISNLRNDADTEVREIQEDIKALEHELKSVNKCYPIIEEYENLYNSLRTEVVSRLDIPTDQPKVKQVAPQGIFDILIRDMQRLGLL